MITSPNKRGGFQKPSNQVFKNITPIEFQYRKEHNLCFKCGDKFTPSHNYKNKEIHMLLVEEMKEMEANGGEEEVIEYRGLKKNSDIDISIACYY